jgi:hypothetical protein
VKLITQKLIKREICLSHNCVSVDLGLLGLLGLTDLKEEGIILF